jgi:hypothetical protein
MVLILVVKRVVVVVGCSCEALGVDDTAGVDGLVGSSGTPEVTGQTVVEMAMVSVMVVAPQSGCSGPQSVTVRVLVV